MLQPGRSAIGLYHVHDRASNCSAPGGVIVRIVSLASIGPTLALELASIIAIGLLRLIGAATKPLASGGAHCIPHSGE